MEFNFDLYGKGMEPKDKILLIDSYVEKILDNISDVALGAKIDDDKFLKKLHNFSITLFETYSILKLYANYKVALAIKSDNTTNNDVRLMYLEKLVKLNKAIPFRHQDFFVLALNFFAFRIPADTLENLDYELPEGVGQF